MLAVLTTQSLIDRLPTVSAAQALQDLQNSASSDVPFGLRSLDATLSGSHEGSGGLSRGKVTELWGPTGAGKTSLAYAVASSLIVDALTALTAI